MSTHNISYVPCIGGFLVKDTMESIYSAVGLGLKVIHDALQSFRYIHAGFRNSLCPGYKHRKFSFRQELIAKFQGSRHLWQAVREELAVG